jgi:hypothetical protein
MVATYASETSGDFQRTTRRHILGQRSPTGGPRENVGGPWRNLNIICNFYVYYTVSLYYYAYYFKQVATNITLIILL